MLLITEADEGCTERMDRKTMTQLINWLKANGKIKIIKSIVQQEDQVLEVWKPTFITCLCKAFIRKTTAVS